MESLDSIYSFVAVLTNGGCQRPLAANNGVYGFGGAVYGLNALARLTALRNQFFGRVPNGVRETLFAVSAFCGKFIMNKSISNIVDFVDERCATELQQTQVIQCVERAVQLDALIVQVLQSCTPGTGDIQCDPAMRARVNRCVLRRTINRRNIVSPRLQRCFRQTLSLATIDCLSRRYRLLRAILPLPPGPAGPVVEFPAEAPQRESDSEDDSESQTEQTPSQSSQSNQSNETSKAGLSKKSTISEKTANQMSNAFRQLSHIKKSVVQKKRKRTIKLSKPIKVKQKHL